MTSRPANWTTPQMDALVFSFLCRGAQAGVIGPGSSWSLMAAFLAKRLAEGFDLQAMASLSTVSASVVTVIFALFVKNSLGSFGTRNPGVSQPLIKEGDTGLLRVVFATMPCNAKDLFAWFEEKGWRRVGGDALVGNDVNATLEKNIQIDGGCSPDRAITAPTSCTELRCETTKRQD